MSTGFESALIQETLSLFSVKESEETWESFNSHLRKWESHVSSYPLTLATKPKLIASLGYFGGIASQITASMLSERTILSATACDLVKAASTVLNADFEALAEVFAPSLLKLCQRTNKVFVRRAEETLVSVVENSKPAKIIPLLCEQLGKSNKNRQSKSSAAKFLVKILQVIETSAPLEPHADALTVAISEGLIDSTPEVRDFSKEMYSMFKKKFPAQALVLLSSLDGRIQKQLEVDMVPKVAKEQVLKPWLANLGGPRKALGSLDENTTTVPLITGPALDFLGIPSAAAPNDSAAPARSHLSSKAQRATADNKVPPAPAPPGLASGSPTKAGRTLGTTKSQRVFSSLSFFGDVPSLPPSAPTVLSAAESTPRSALSKPQRTLMNFDFEQAEPLASIRAMESKPKRAALVGPVRVIDFTENQAEKEKEKPGPVVTPTATEPPSKKRAAPSSPIVREDKKKQQRVVPHPPQITTKEGPPSQNPPKPKETNANPARPVKVAVRSAKQPEKEKGEVVTTTVTAPKASHPQVPKAAKKEDAAPAAPQEPTPSTLSMEEILPLCVNSDWSVKVTGFENLGKKLETAHHEVSSKQQRVLELILEGLSDKHFRVLQSVLDSLSPFVKRFPESLKAPASLQKVVVPVLNILSEPALQAKKGVLSTAENLLKLLIDVFCGEDFLLLLVRMVPEQSKNPKRFAVMLDMLSNGIKKQQTLIEAARDPELNIVHVEEMNPNQVEEVSQGHVDDMEQVPPTTPLVEQIPDESILV